MKKMPIFLALPAIWLVSVSFAEPVEFKNSQGDLSVKMFVAPDHGFVEEWVSAPPEKVPALDRVKEASFGQMITAGFVVSGLAVDAQQNADYEIDVFVLAPDGKTLYGQKAYARSSKKFSSRRGVSLAEPVLDLRIDKGDPTGVYKIVAKAHDLVSDKTAATSHDLEIKP